MGLIYADSEAQFSSGAAHFEIGPARRSGHSERFLVQVDIGGHKTQAFVDTGAPFSGIVTMETEFVSKKARNPVVQTRPTTGTSVT
jgi:predicted aspartyl protease